MITSARAALKDVATSGKDAGKVIAHVTSIEDGSAASLPLDNRATQLGSRD